MDLDESGGFTALQLFRAGVPEVLSDLRIMHFS